MKSLKFFPRLTAHFAAALLLLNSAPVPVAAQRRRQQPTTPRPTTTPRPNVSAPKPNTTQTPPSHPSLPTPPPTRAQQTRRQEPDLSFEEMLAGDSYSVYAEVRRVGTLAQAEELKTAVGAVGLFGDETKPLTDLFRFVSDNNETLAEARVVVTFMPARAGLPQTLLAVELPSAEAAVAFEPKFRRLLGEQVREVKKVIDPQPVKSETRDTAQPPSKQKAEPKAAAKAEQKAEPKTAAPDFALRRAGRWLIAAESPFTLRALRGDEGEPRFADSTRFQTVRGRFGSESLFVYVDTNVAQQGWALQQQKANAPQSEVALTATTGGDNPGSRVGVAEKEPALPVATTATLAQTPTENAPMPEPTVSDEGQPPEEGGEAAAQGDAPSLAAVEVTPPPAPTEEQLAVQGMGGVLRNLWSGIPRIPGAVALGLRLERGALVMRLAVENTPDGTIAIIPFLPNIVSGPPVTADSASVAPADSELFFAASLDWTQIYNSTLGAASVNPAMLGAASWGDEPEGTGKGERPPTAEQSIAAVEKLFGFKFKEDLLPALGNEVALSMPLDTGDFGFRMRSRTETEKKEEKDAEPGFIYIASLNNADKMREILPRVLVALGLTSLGEAARPAERREGFEIHGAGSLAYTIINNFLVLGELKAVRHCIDSFDKRQTLAASNSYRDSTSWQAKQKLVHLFVSDTIMRNVIEETKKRSGGSTDAVVRSLFTQLETAQPEPASYEATNEGDVLIHELRLPLSFVRSYAVAMAVNVKDAPVINGEMMAVYALNRIESAEATFKDEKKKERYGTFEELVAEELLEKNFAEHMEYTFELNATSDKFEVTATPKTYGKSGRRSFFLDETGKMRGADRKGQHATADDPPVD